MNLLEQIENRRKEIFTDSYPMSIGEIVNLYKDGELKINPAFQRFFRWTPAQKVRLIESILLGIPLPSVFVAQREDGVWDLVDGLQRVSTILNFMGELLDEVGNVVSPLILTSTEYLPLLENVSWDGQCELDSSLKRTFKREKIEVKIIKKESDSSTKFELFQRLNTGGSQLSDQEVRNCLLIMLNDNFYETLDAMSKHSSFLSSIDITERLKEQRYEMELILRLLALGNSTEDELKRIPDVSDFLTTKAKLFAEADMDWSLEKDLVFETFDYMYSALGDNSFRKQVNGDFKGGFQLTIFEVLSVGVYIFLKSGKDKSNLKDLISEASRSLAGNATFERYSGSGQKANYRWPKFVPLSRELFLQ